jgi:hypothetical protein
VAVVVVVFTKQVVVSQDSHLQVEEKVAGVVVETEKMDQKIMQEIRMPLPVEKIC